MHYSAAWTEIGRSMATRFAFDLTENTGETALEWFDRETRTMHAPLNTRNSDPHDIARFNLCADGFTSELELLGLA